MSTNQPRRPAGTPAGGEWAPAGHDEADISLEVPRATADETEVDAALALFSKEKIWPVYEAKNGAHYLVSGLWSTDEKTYEWQHVEAALFDLQDCPLASKLETWRGEDVREVLAVADPSYDGDFWKNSGKTSFAVLYHVKPGVPLQLKHGTTWRTGGGRSKATYQGAEDYVDYRRRSRELLAARGIDLAAPKLAREKREAEKARRRRERERHYG